MNSIPFAFSINPGEILRTEFMEPLGLTAYRLAKDLQISAPRINDLLAASAASQPTLPCASAATSATPPSFGSVCRAVTISGLPQEARQSTR